MAESDVLKDASIGDLRALAKSYGIKAERSWVRNDFIVAIKQAQESGVLVVEDDEDDEAQRIIANYSLPVNVQHGAANKGAPKPGYARIILHKDPTPDHANSPVPVGLNGRTFMVPRGIPVDLPIPFLGVLRDAVQIVTRQTKEPDRDHLEGTVTREEVLSFPYQIVAVTPGGKFVNPEDQRSASAQRRKAFHNEMQRWPTDGELLEWEKANAARAARN